MPLSSKAQAELDELLATLDLLSDDDAWFLADQWEREDAGARKRAWAAAKAAIDERGLTNELDRVRSSIGGWMATNRSDFQGIDGLLGNAGSGAGARQSAAPALMDAAAALLAGDALDEEDAAVLLRPWDALDEDDEDSND